MRGIWEEICQGWRDGAWSWRWNVRLFPWCLLAAFIAHFMAPLLDVDEERLGFGLSVPPAVWLLWKMRKELPFLR